MYFQFLEFSRNSVNQIIRPNGTRSMLNAERDKKKNPVYTTGMKHLGMKYLG